MYLHLISKVEICREHGIACKVTGAGMGGNNLALIPADFGSEAVMRLASDLELEGFNCMNFDITNGFASYEILKN